MNRDALPIPPEAGTLDAALTYARRWPIIPLHSIRGGSCTCGREDCSSPGKHPRTANGKDDATTDVYIIRDWWRKWPDANIGLLTGEISGIVVLDLDGPAGLASFRALEECHGEILPTVEASTGGGGQHIYCNHPGITVPNRTRVEPGIDVRGDGGYVVAPPSNHISGKCYRWDEKRSPAEIELAEMPAWLLELITKQPSERHECNDSAHADSRGLLLQRAQQYIAKAKAANEGSRNSAAFSLAGHLAAMDATGNRLNEAEILILLRP